MIYYDANIFLSFFKNENNEDEVSFLFEDDILCTHKVYFSSFVQLEAMFLFGNNQKKQKSDIFTLKSIFGNKYFTSISLSPETIDICYELYKNHKISHEQKDIIHVASAMQSKCKYLVTLDRGFIKKMESVEGNDIPKVLSPSSLKLELGLII